jgi:hypothetical protein
MRPVYSGHSSLSEFMQRVFAPVAEARWNGTEDRDTCYPGTRSDLLQTLTTWASAMDGPRVCWISGGAGTGKSTIATTVCEKLEKEGLLACSYFISRQSDGRHDARGIVRTLAYDLAQIEPDFCQALLRLIRKDSRITNGLVKDQVARLIAEPLGHIERSSGHRVLVLDAFDECDKDKDGREGGPLLPLVLDAISQANTLVKLLITSRPETTISDMTSHYLSSGQLQKEDLQAIPASVVEKDIRLFLMEELKSISSKCHLVAWPSPSDLDKLIRLAGVLFIYASTVIKFVGDIRFSPLIRLSVVLNTTRVNAQSASLYSQLDDLYMQLLYTAVQKRGMTIVYDGAKHPQPRVVDIELCGRLRTVVGSIVLLRDPVPLNTLEDLLWDDDRDEIGITARMLSSVLLVTDGQPIHTLHPSFREFLLDNNRCSDERFQINQGERHLHLTLGCLLVMNKHLQRNMCDIMDSSLLNSEVEDLQERVDRYVPAAVQYACKYWISHLAAATQRPISQQGEKWIGPVKTQLSTFCSEHLLHWMEVTSLVNHFPSSLSGFNTAMRWCSVCWVHLSDSTETNLA